MITPTPPQPKKKRSHGNEEAKLQASCVQWLWNAHEETRGLYFAVSNENTRSVYETKRQQLVSGSMRKAMGTLAGVSDTILLLPRGDYHAACIEFKTPIGRQSDAQRLWQQKVEGAGYYYVVVRSVEQFKEEIEKYLSL